MPQDPEHGQRFAEDMRRIREAHHLTVGDVHDETKIPQGLIEAFEDKALFDHPQFNRVYLRSFVRTYAQVVNIDPDVALEGLEEALSGRYAGSLAVEYLGEEPAGAEAPSTTEEAPSDADEEGAAAAEPPGQRAKQEPEERKPEETPPPKTSKKKAAAPPPSDGETSRPAAEETTEAPKVDEPSKEAESEEVESEEVEEAREADDAGPSYVSTTQATAAGYQETADEADVEDEAAGDWTAQSPPAASASETRRAPSRSSGLDRRWVLGGAIVVVVGVLVWILASVLGGSDAPEAGQTIAADTAQTVESPDTAATATPAAAPANIPSLGDTMNVRIVASNGKVDPIRVTVDDDLRRPYWIDEGDSMTFRPTSRIVVEELLDSVDVRIEGIDYPMDRRDDQGRIVITRDTAQSYFASLRGGQ